MKNSLEFCFLDLVVSALTLTYYAGNSTPISPTEIPTLFMLVICTAAMHVGQEKNNKNHFHKNRVLFPKKVGNVV